MSLDAATQARLVGLFVAEAEEAVAALQAAHRQLEAGTGDEALQHFGRTAHGLKGAAAALGFEPLARCLHALEDVSLGLPGATGPARLERLSSLAQALALLEEGVGQMGRASLLTFPAGLQAGLERTLGLAATAGPTAAAGATAAAAEQALERLSVPAAELDLALRLAASVARMALQLQEQLAAVGPGAAAAVRGVAAEAEQLEAVVAGLRLLPAEEALSGVEEEVASLARRLGREVELAVEGRAVRADRRTLQAARGLVRHLVRNALDHGLEPPAERRRAGKAATGRLTIRVASDEAALKVTVEDDGAGFDVAAARSALVRQGAGEDLVAGLTEAEVLGRFAAGGGSTRGTVTDVSGRGLGLSAVAAQARQAGGRFAIRTDRGRGSAVTFTLPLDVYAVELLVASCGGQAVGLPIHGLEGTVLLATAAAALHQGPAGRTLAAGEGLLPLWGLGALLGTPAGTGAERFALLVRSDEGTVALGVEEIGAVQAVVPTAVRGVTGAGSLVSGLARLADGTAIQVLDPRALVAAALRLTRGSPSPRVTAPPPDGSGGDAPGAAPARRAPLDVVLAEDSLATREVLRVLLEGQGFRVRLAADGEEALARLRERVPDVLVSDLNMPRRDGLSLTRALREDPATAGVAVVLLTSQDDEATRVAGAAAGADAYLVKSRFSASVLAETLAGLGLGRLP